MKPAPIKAFRLSNLSNVLFNQASEIKRLRAENAQLRADNTRKDKLLLDMQRHSKGITAEMATLTARIKGIVEKWNEGILSSTDIE